MLSMMDAVERIRKADGEPDIVSCLTQFSAQAGYEFWHIAKAANGNVPLTKKKLVGVWSPTWLEEYDRQRFFDDDAISHSCRTLGHAFRWSDIPITRSRSKKVMAVAADFRMRDGFCVPYFGMGGYQGGISFGGSNIDRSRDGDLSLEVVAIFAFNRLNEVKVGNAKQLLTPRQREVMQWIAAGKTTWDTAAILRISEETVRTTVKGAMSRLNTHTRAQAIAEALRLQEIRA